MKLISFYLPQFHEIAENNDAWGEGFTEWVNVKNAFPLYFGHCQPKKPLHHNYYNLLDDGIMKWQMALAKKAGIYGFCFYHYWFNGRLVLEKPAEMLLQNKEINFHYCFSWANEPWTKTWHGAAGEKEILIAQIYGGEEEWKRHYDYFKQFFLDKRYIKKDNCPVLLIYRLRNIPCFNDMISYWNKCAKQDGFSGIFIVSMNVCRENVAKSRWVNGSVDFEPNKAKSEMTYMPAPLRPKNKKTFLWNRFAVKMISYQKLNNEMLKATHKENHFRTVFVNFDTSPRRKERAIIAAGSTPKRFGRYLRKSIQKSKKEGNEFLFINAWNEWGEGNYLEPDVKNGYAYLKQVREVVKKEIARRTIKNQ